MGKFDINNFVVDKIKTVYAIERRCHVCGFDNSEDEVFHVCPICRTNLVVETANISEGETFCAGFMFNK